MHLAAGIAAGIAAYLLGVTPVWSLVIGALHRPFSPRRPDSFAARSSA